MPSNDEPLIICVQALECKHATLMSQMALAQGNVLIQASHAANAKQNNHSTHIQPVCPISHTRDTSTPPLKAVPPTIPSRTSTKGNSTISSQFSLGHVASFVADLRGKAAATRSTCVTGPSRPTLFLDVEGTPRTT
jgi:hypothetical protein